MNKSKNTNIKQTNSPMLVTNNQLNDSTLNKIQDKSEYTDNTVEDPRSPIEKKAHKLLKNNGMLDAYKYVLANICKDGLPEGDIFEYSAYLFGSYEKKWKNLKSKEIKEKIKNYKEEKLSKLKQKGII